MDVEQEVKEAPCAADTEEAAPPTGANATVDTVVKLGYKTFTNADDCYLYFNNIARNFQQRIDLNEYEFVAARDLLEKTCPEQTKKGKVKACQVSRRKRNGKIVPQFAFRVGNSKLEDADYVKCINMAFPDPVSEELLNSDADKLQKLLEAKKVQYES